MSSFNLNQLYSFKSIKKQLKLHWLDLMVVCIIVAIGAVLLWQRSQRKTEWLTVQLEVTQAEWWWMSEGPKAWYANGLTSTEWGYNSFGEKVAQIQKIEVVDTGSGRNQIMIQAKLKVAYDPKRDTYTFGFQGVQIGKAIEVNLGKQTVKGLIVALDLATAKSEEKLVRLRIGSIDPAIADSYFEGLQARTLDGQPIATIIKLKTFTTVVGHFSDIRNQIVMVENPQFKTVEATVKLRVYKFGDQYLYADGKPIKIGSTLTLQFPQLVFPDAQILGWVD